MTLSRVLKTSITILDNIEGYLCKFFLSFFVILLFFQVIMRTVFQNSLAWSEEASRFAFVWFAFLGASYAARLGAHNRVTFQFKLFPKIVGDVSQIIADGIWLVFNAIMTVKSIEVIRDMMEFPFYSPALDIPMQYIYMLFPFTFTLMSIRIIQVNILKHILKRDIVDVDDISTDLEDIKRDMKIDSNDEGRMA
ncbi:MAG: TRAP transporter small permease [Desulfotignum balticum]|uniref:TRAP transporter small permease n=1 Tax=Desulfotignum balticum TaxID=115781 RepID=A0A931CTV7_9BACT|nr:TRAP transporter small permease [Desulfotignum balticum]